MIIRCTNCDAAYSVDDDKVDNKRFAFTCPKCTTENIIDNRKQAGVAIADADTAMAGGALADTDDFSSDFEQQEQDLSFEEDSVADEVTADSADIDIDESAIDDFDLDLSEESVETGSNDLDLGDTSLETEIDDLDLGNESIDTEIDDLDLGIESVESEIDDFDIPTTDESPERGQPTGEADVPLDDIDAAQDIEEFETSDTGTNEEPVISDDIEDDELKLSIDEISDDIVELGETEIADEQDDISDFDQAVEEDMADLDVSSTDDFSEEDIDVDSILLEEEARQEGTAEESISTDIIDDMSPIEEDTVSFDDDLDLQDIDIDEIDIGEDESTVITDDFSGSEDDDSVTIDLDSLDIELEGDEEFREGESLEADMEPDLAMMQDEQDIETVPGDDDVTLDLDSLDLDLAESDTILEGEQPEDVDFSEYDIAEEPAQNDMQRGSQPEEDVTLDLDSLDITLEETDEIMEGETPDEEKLTLEDAGLTLDELTTEETAALEQEMAEDSDEDIKLTIDDIDPSLSVDNIEDGLIDDGPSVSEITAEEEELLINEIDELPEIDIDDNDFDTGIAVPAGTSKRTTDDLFDDELIDINIDEEDSSYGADYEQKDIPDIAARGSVNFSIDYSIKYSRLGALSRLLLIFFLTLIPHFIVFFIYMVISIFLSFINHIVVISRRDTVEDFTQIGENSIRYFLAINTSMVGIVEDMPIFAGRDHIDHPLQMKVIYPLHYSRWRAIMRLSLVGITLMMLPHLVIIGLLSLVLPIVSLAGIISVLILGRWPHILFDFLTRYYRYCARALLFSVGVIDQYPTFKFD